MNTSKQNKTGVAQPQNDFKPFATDTDANVIDQSEYETLAALGNGFRKGLARSSELNKVMRQSSSITAALARFMAAKTEEAILDNGDIDILSSQIEAAIGSVSSLLIAEADGTADALTASFIPTIKELKNGLLVHVRAKTVNTTSTPDFKANETGIKTIVKGNNLPLEAGDIAGAGHWLELQYDEELDKWILQNPAKGVTPQSGVPVGTIEYFATATPPAGYLKADGAAVGRETYPELFAAIGTTFGEGDGETTFNLPDLINRFAQGSNTPGQKIEAGLPNIEGSFGDRQTGTSKNGCFYLTYGTTTGGMADGVNIDRYIGFDASRSNSIYGASDTVQPPALTLLPCIKAFDAATNPGLIDITGLANDMKGKLDRVIESKPVRYVIDAYNDGTNWYRKWSDGWLEQGGILAAVNSSITLIFLLPFLDNKYSILKNIGSTLGTSASDAGVSFQDLTQTSAKTVQSPAYVSSRWYACGQGARS